MFSVGDVVSHDNCDIKHTQLINTKINITPETMILLMSGELSLIGSKTETTRSITPQESTSPFTVAVVNWSIELIDSSGWVHSLNGDVDEDDDEDGAMNTDGVGRGSGEGGMIPPS